MAEEQEDDLIEAMELNKQHSSASKKAVKKESFLAFAKRMLKKLYDIFKIVAEYFWVFFEMHLYKITVVTIALYCLYKVISPTPMFSNNKT